MEIIPEGKASAAFQHNGAALDGIAPIARLIQHPNLVPHVLGGVLGAALASGAIGVKATGRIQHQGDGARPLLLALARVMACLDTSSKVN